MTRNKKEKFEQKTSNDNQQYSVIIQIVTQHQLLRTFTPAESSTPGNILPYFQQSFSERKQNYQNKTE